MHQEKLTQLCTYVKQDPRPKIPEKGLAPNSSISTYYIFHFSEMAFLIIKIPKYFKEKLIFIRTQFYQC